MLHNVFLPIQHNSRMPPQSCLLLMPLRGRSVLMYALAYCVRLGLLFGSTREMILLDGLEPMAGLNTWELAPATVILSWTFPPILTGII